MRCGSGDGSCIARPGVGPHRDRASLVVAGIEGDAGQQTWENVGRTLQVADGFVEADGAIAVCCDLAIGPGPALRRMAHAQRRESARRHVERQRAIDAVPAAQLARALNRHKVYLLSRLDPSVVEDLDVIPVAGADELLRLARQHRIVPAAFQCPVRDADCGGTDEGRGMKEQSARIAENVARVRGRIAEAAARSGRAASQITLVAVTKYVSAEMVRPLIAAGCVDLGRAGRNSFGRRPRRLAICRSAGT